MTGELRVVRGPAFHFVAHQPVESSEIGRFAGIVARREPSEREPATLYEP